MLHVWKLIFYNVAWYINGNTQKLAYKKMQT